MSEKIITSNHEVAEGSIRSYTTGFVSSVVLTLLAFGLIMSNAVNGGWAIAVVIALALVQLFVQVRYFLHLGTGSTRRWNLTVFAFMLLVVVILVVGTLWIMRNLDYHHETRTPQQIDRDLSRDENISQ